MTQLLFYHIILLSYLSPFNKIYEIL